MEPSNSDLARAAERCDCYCCRWDKEAAERKRAGQPAAPPDFEPYTAAQLLECPSFRQVGAYNYFSQEERDWWDTQGPEVMRWLAQDVAAGFEHVEPAKFAATCLLQVPVSRADGDDPNREPREPFSWDEIDAYEILFEYFVHTGGPPSFWDCADYLAAMRRFAAHLCRRGLIPLDPDTLDRDFALWTPRVLEVLDGAPWWTRDGGRVGPMGEPL